MIRKQLTELLASFDHRVTAVAEAAEAYLHIETEAPDLLVADVHMPGQVNGMQLAHVATSLAPGLGILIISGKPIDRLDLPDGAACLQNPFTSEAL